MGLDGVELVLAVEERFGITIKNSEAERIRTVGDLMALIRSRMAAGLQPCPHLPAFLSLRKLVRELSQDDRLRIRPRDRVTAILSPQLTRKLWRSLPRLLDGTPKTLLHPRAMQGCLTFLALTTFLVALQPIAIDRQFVLASLFVWVLLMIAGRIATNPWRCLPPPGWQTFGDLTRHVVGTITVTKPLDLETDDELLQALRPVIADALGVDAAEIQPQSRFVEDLGVG